MAKNGTTSKEGSAGNEVPASFSSKTVQKGHSFEVIWQTKISNSAWFDVVTKFLGEFFGTAILLFLGCLGCLDGFDNTTSNFSRGVIFGFTVMVAIVTFGVVSGAHINPSVSIAAFVYGDLSAVMTLVYFVAQFTGAICGYGLLKAVAPSEYFDDALGSGHGSCVTAPHASLSTGAALGIEFLVTAIMIWGCCGVWDPRNAKQQDSVPIKFALMVAAIAVAAGPATGGSMNPARTLAPCLWNNSYHRIWIYFVGPPLAGIVMPIVYKYVFRKEVKATDTAETDGTREQVCVSVVHK